MYILTFFYAGDTYRNIAMAGNKVKIWYVKKLLPIWPILLLVFIMNIGSKKKS